VPLQDEERTIESLLRSLTLQTRPPDEIVLVDAGSRDGTFARVAAFSARLPVQVVAAGRVYPGLARNVGVTAAKHDWLALTDGGVVPDASWLAGLAERAGPDVDVVYGSYEPVCDSYFTECAAIAYVSPRDASGTRGPSVASCLLRREAFNRAGGFPPFRAAEDLIFFRRLSETPARVSVAPEAVVRWQIAGNVGATFRRFESYSYHNLVAGWARHWHAGTARLYAGLVVVVAGASLLGGIWASAIVPVFFVARAGKAAYLKRASFDFRTTAVSRVLGAAFVLAILDLATLVGFLRWLLTRALR
jgi:glycosyltransferase involved in cell wall biosynthesis